MRKLNLITIMSIIILSFFSGCKTQSETITIPATTKNTIDYIKRHFSFKKSINYNRSNQIISYSINEFDSKGLVCKSIGYDKGDDNQWFTNDDSAVQLYDVAFNSFGHPTKVICKNYSGQVQGYSKFDYDDNNRLIRIICYDESGMDDQWFTSDDHIGFYNVFTFDSNGKILKSKVYDGVGTDNNTFPTDDTIRINIYQTYDWSDAGYIKKITSYDKGPDGLWYTADDTISGYSIVEY